MIAAKFDPQQFFRRVDAVALLVPAAEVFGLLRRTIDLPSEWAALVLQEAGASTVVPAGGVVRGDGAEFVMFVRTTPVEIQFQRQGLASKDELGCDVEARVRIAPIAERSELHSFCQSLMTGRRAVTVEVLAKYVEGSMVTALAEEVGARKAEELVSGESGEALSKSIGDSLQGLCFSGGLTLRGTPTIQVKSSAYERKVKTREQSVVRLGEQEAAREVQKAAQRAQAEHLDHLGSLLARLKQMAENSPNAELADLIRTFDQRQRGEIYQALFASTVRSQRTRWVVVAVGEEVLFYAADDLASPHHRLHTMGPCGAVRSVQHERLEHGEDVLWLGAANGVYRLPLSRVEPDQIFQVPGVQSVRGGFNSVYASGDRLFASHSELGIWSWPRMQSDGGQNWFEPYLRSAKAVRGITGWCGDLFCAVDDRVFVWNEADSPREAPRQLLGSGSTITSLFACEVGVFAGNSEGELLHWLRDQESAPERISPGQRRAVESLWMVATQGVRRLIYTDTSIHVHARVLGDSFRCTYEAGGQILRRVDVSPDLIVATTELRDRLIFWDPSKPQQPLEIVPVSAQCGRSIQDVCLVPAAPEESEAAQT